MASAALTRNSAFGELQAQMQKHVSTFAAALPRYSATSRDEHLSRAQRCARVAMTQIRLTPKLLDCSPASVLGTVLQACQLGLELDGVMGQAYMVPYGRECQMQVGYRGMAALAVRSGKIAYVKPTLVYLNEHFEVEEGTSPRIVHRPRLTDRGELIGVYAVAPTTNSAPAVFRLLTLEDVHKRRDASKAGSRGPWKDWYEEMVMKTAVRALCKHLPQCPDAQRAAVHDEYVESGHAPPPPSIDEYAAEVVECEAEVKHAD